MPNFVTPHRNRNETMLYTKAQNHKILLSDFRSIELQLGTGIWDISPTPIIPFPIPIFHKIKINEPPFQALPITADFVSVDQLCRINAEIECKPPNKKVNEFTGTMQMGNQRLPLCETNFLFIHLLYLFTRSSAIQQFLLRGAKLKNCKWVYGVVIYTGHDSRLLMNSTAAPLKTWAFNFQFFLFPLIDIDFSSRIDTMTNRRTVILFLLLIAITFVR